MSLRRILLLVIAVAIGLGVWFREPLRGLWNFATLFQEDRMVENFRSLPERWPARRIERAGPVFEFDRRPVPLPDRFAYRGGEVGMREFLARRVTTGLVVIQDDAIVSEEYFLGNGEETHTISWSIGKSYVSALVGIAIGEGHIAGIEEPVTRYAPELAGSGYDGVSLKDVLQMSSGVRFREVYGDPTSDINRMGFFLALGRPLRGFVKTLERERPPGTFNQYVSMDTQVLGIVLAHATGRSISEYLEEKVWQRIGHESHAWWLLDGAGVEWAFGGLNVVLRDFARFGRLYRDGGMWQGEPVVPREWVRASLTPDAPHLQPGENEASDSRLGYGYQWWVPEGTDGEFMALGVYGQFIYVHPGRRLVIVKTSADPRFEDDDYESERETLAAFRAIGRRLEN